MALPATRLDDKINATQFRALAGLVLSVEAHYCLITSKDIPQVELSPVIQADFSTRRICLVTDLALDIDNSYSPFHNIAFYRIQWGDGTDTGWVAWGGGPGAIAYGAAAGEWPDLGTYTVTISVRDDAGGGVGGPFEASIDEQIEVVDCTEFPFDAWAGLDGPDGVYRATTWIARSNGLTGGWLHINDIDVNDSVRIGGHAEVWIATDDGLAFSQDGGDTWTKIVLDDPPNVWGAAPPPTAADLSYVGFARSLTSPNECYVIAEDNALGVWGSWLLFTADNWATWTWYNTGGGFQDDTLRALALLYTNDEVPYNTLIKGDAVVLQGGGIDDPAYGWDWSAGAGAGLDILWTPENNIAAGLTVGFEAFVDAAVAFFVTTDPSGTGMAGCTLDLFNVAVPNVWEYLQLVGAICGPFAGGVQYTFKIRYFGLVPTLRRGRRWWIWANEEPLLGNGRLDAMRVLSVGIDNSTLYMTTWEESAGSTALCLRVYDTSSGTPTLIRKTILGACTLVELAARTYYASVTTLGVSQILIVGRWDDGTVRHVFRSADAGETLTDIGDSATWGVDWIAAAVWEEWDLIYLCRNGGSDQLLKTIDAGVNWTVQSALAFEVAPRAFRANPDFVEEFIVGNRVAGNVRYSMDDGGTWFDTSAGLPAGGDVNVIRLLSER